VEINHMYRVVADPATVCYTDQI